MNISAPLAEIDNTCTNSLKKISNKSISDFQFMDKIMLEKIKSNNPHYELPALGESNVELYLSLAYSLAVKDEWFADKSLINSMNGMRHLQRTSYFAFVLSKQLRLSNKQVLCAVIAALLHDIRRSKDLKARDYNTATVQWFNSNLNKIGSEWGLSIRKSYFKKISTAIELCSIPYKDFSADQQSRYLKAYKLVDVLKTADALDRYRLPQFSGKFNNLGLRLLPSSATKQMAYNLVILSESNGLKDCDNFLNVLNAINTDQITYRNLKYQWSKKFINFED
jgi:hypothetical protein